MPRIRVGDTLSFPQHLMSCSMALVEHSQLQQRSDERNKLRVELLHTTAQHPSYPSTILGLPAHRGLMQLSLEERLIVIDHAFLEISSVLVDYLVID
jgi:hypothetical protein